MPVADMLTVRGLGLGEVVVHCRRSPPLAATCALKRARLPI